MRGSVPFLRLAFIGAMLATGLPVGGQPVPVLIWITNSSVKLEQINGDVDWEAKAQGSNLLTASQTVTRFHILGNGLGYSFEEFAPIMIERFTRITNSTLFIYYTLSTWNPYAVVKMRSALIISPVIDPGSLVHKTNKFRFSWNAPTNISYQVDYSSGLLSGWTTFTDIITSTSGLFDFTYTQTGGLPTSRFYRLRTSP